MDLFTEEGPTPQQANAHMLMVVIIMDILYGLRFKGIFVILNQVIDLNSSSKRRIVLKKLIA